MNWEDRDIDKLFKAEASNSSFEYKDAYWKEMEAMLPKNSVKGILWMITAFVSLGIIAISFFNTNSFDTNSTLLAENTKSITQNRTQESNIIEQSTSPTILNDSNEVKNKNKHLEKINQTASKENTSNSSQTERKIETKEELNPEINNDTKAFQDNSITKRKTKKGFNGGQQTQNAYISSVTSTRNFNETENKLNTFSTLRNEEIENNDEHKEVTTELSLRKLALIPHRDADLSTSPLQAPSPIRKQLYLQLLGGTSQSMVIPSNSPSYNIGVGIGLQLNKGKFVFNTGINGLMSFHDNLLLSRQAKVYSFGSDVVQYEIKYKELFSLEADLSIGYQFSRHIIIVGVRPSYIIGTKAGYREQIGTNEVSNNYYGITQGINRFGIKPMIGYTYILKRDFSIGFNIGMQLMPLINEDFVSGMNRTLPIDGQIYLRKTIHFRR